MLNKYAIEYAAFPHHPHGRSFTHFTDDPIEAEDFLMSLLATRARILAIRHDGVEVIGTAFDRLLKVAVDRVASALMRESLSLNSIQVKDRFGFAA